MNVKAEQFFENLKEAVETDKLFLPSLPEVALKIRDVVESEEATARQIADTLSQDAALSAKLIRVANSSMYGFSNPIDDLQMAVTRLGLGLVRDLVISLAMKQIYQATSDVLDEQFRSIWNKALDVAAICRMLSTTVTGISPEQAFLAGLVHNIGALPILAMAEDDDDLFNDAEALDDVISELQGPVGELILRSWNFPDHMREVVEQYHNFSYAHDGGVRFIDLVQVALLQGGHITRNIPEDWSSVPAFEKMGIEAEVNVVDIEENREMIESAKEALMV